MIQSDKLNCDGNGEPRQMHEIIDLIVRNRIAFVMDDIYSIKKQLEGQKCPKEDSTRMGVQTLHNQKNEKCVNFASMDLGARIVKVEADPLCPTNVIKNFLGMKYASNPPIKMLENNVEPGNCFAFKSEEAKVLLKLPYPVYFFK